MALPLYGAATSAGLQGLPRTVDWVQISALPAALAQRALWLSPMGSVAPPSLDCPLRALRHLPEHRALAVPAFGGPVFNGLQVDAMGRHCRNEIRLIALNRVKPGIGR